jgi:hypothetical protein
MSIDGSITYIIGFIAMWESCFNSTCWFNGYENWMVGSDWTATSRQIHVKSIDYQLSDHWSGERTLIAKNVFCFFSEGFKEAAERFAEESGMSLNKIDFTSVEERLKSRQAIEAGRIEQAIALINQFIPHLLEQNRELAFHLKVGFFSWSFGN